MDGPELSTETIVAISTPPGRGGIGIVRLSGPDAAAIAAQLVRLRQPLDHGRARVADVLDGSGGEAEQIADSEGNADKQLEKHSSGAKAHVSFSDLSARLKSCPDTKPDTEQNISTVQEGRIDEAVVTWSAAPKVQEERIDEAVVTFFGAPHSYTSEDLVEIAAHGSPVVLELLLRRALELGARLAEPGEFTQRAFLAGRLDLTQAEAVRDLIDAQTLTQARQAASQMGGALSRRVNPVKTALVELIALLEAGIDFAEDDVDVTAEAEIARRIGELTPPLRAMEASFARGRIVHDGLTMAIVGRPNVGKSSLFNRLVERERAIVTATPGTTRDLVTERISLDGIPVEMVDTAGLREGLEEAEQLGIARSREALADAALVLVVLDATQTLNEEEHRLLEAVKGRPALVAVNKCDLAKAEEKELGNSSLSGAKAHVDSVGRVRGLKPPPPSEPNAFAIRDGAVAQEIGGVAALATSALTGEGIAALRERILALATGGAAAEPGMLTSLRHHQSITTALAALGDAALANANKIPHEMILLDLYRALWAMDSLTGQTTSDDILNLIFSTFCIGK